MPTAIIISQGPRLVRYCEPEADWNPGLWLLIHPDLKRTAIVLAFRNMLQKQSQPREAYLKVRI